MTITLRIEKWEVSGQPTGYRVLRGYGPKLQVLGAYAADASDQDAMNDAKSKAHRLAQSIVADQRDY
jgi:hypothetical protein